LVKLLLMYEALANPAAGLLPGLCTNVESATAHANPPTRRLAASAAGRRQLAAGSPPSRCRFEIVPTATTLRLGRVLLRAFFEDPPERVARRLLGKILVQRISGREPIAGRIVEVEAYLGPHRQPPDPAAHACHGLTPRNQVLFGPAGHAYVYSIYGRYFCMNVSCEPEGQAGCVLLRALEPLTGIDRMARNRGLAPTAGLREFAGGPGRLCQALAIERCTHNGLDLLDPSSTLQLLDDGARPRRITVTPRIGIRHGIELPLRFALAGNACVSGPKSMGRE
jgi:DNA-3-methyladenine glycosylase